MRERLAASCCRMVDVERALRAGVGDGPHLAMPPAQLSARKARAAGVALQLQQLDGRIGITTDALERRR
jgi:hypothetical protein